MRLRKKGNAPLVGSLISIVVAGIVTGYIYMSISNISNINILNEKNIFLSTINENTIVDLQNNVVVDDIFTTTINNTDFITTITKKEEFLDYDLLEITTSTTHLKETISKTRLYKLYKWGDKINE